MGNENEPNGLSSSSSVPYVQMVDEDETIADREHECDDQQRSSHGSTQGVVDRQNHDHSKSSQRSLSAPNDNSVVISNNSSVMDAVEADEIISAAEGFGGSRRTPAEAAAESSLEKAEKQHPSKEQRLQQSAATMRVLSKKLILANLLANFLMCSIAGFITYHCFNKATVLFSWHPTFMSIGFFVLMSQAVLTLSGANLLTYKLHQKTRIFIHWLLQTSACILITIAFVCIFLNKVRMDKPHFQTTHGLIGLITVVFTLASVGGGVFAKYGFQLRHLMRPIYSKIVHGVAGTVTYILGMVSIALGVNSRWFAEDNNAQVRLTLLIGIIAVTLYVIINPIAATISRTKTALRSTL